MTYTLTTDESKGAECGSIDYSKFTDSTAGWYNIDLMKYLGTYEKFPCNEEGITFIAQDVLDLGYTKDQARIIINSLITKGVLIDTPWTLYDMQTYKTSELNPYLQTIKDKVATIDNNWMYYLSEPYINYIAAKK